MFAKARSMIVYHIYLSFGSFLQASFEFAPPADFSFAFVFAFPTAAPTFAAAANLLWSIVILPWLSAEMNFLYFATFV